MTGNLLVLNAGSSSLKFALFDGNSMPDRLAEGSVKRIGSAPQFAMKIVDARDETRPLGEGSIDLGTAAALLFDELESHGLLNSIAAVGHRIVHGGITYCQPVQLDAGVLSRLERLVPLAPLHQPYNLDIVRLASSRLPGAVPIGCFDTAFHASRPQLDRLYALPRNLTDEGLIAYGFHGLSYAHIAAKLRELEGPRAGGRTIVAHLGSGASMCAMDCGSSIATTMGFSALDGLVMATRCGAVDPGMLLHLMTEKDMDAATLSTLLYSQSGLLGVSGISGDMQVLLDSNAPQAAEAIDLYVYRAVGVIGSLAARLGGLDSLVFTAGVGENSPIIRERICAGAAWLGMELDPAANRASHSVISSPASGVTVRVVPADEELAILNEMVFCLNQSGQG